MHQTAGGVQEAYGELALVRQNGAALLFYYSSLVGNNGGALIRRIGGALVD